MTLLAKMANYPMDTKYISFIPDYPNGIIYQLLEMAISYPYNCKVS